MKVIMINSIDSEGELYTYNRELIEQLKNNYSVSMYSQTNDDFSNIPELFDDDEKLVMFNQFALKGGFKKLSENLPRFKNVKYLLSPYSSYSELNLDLLKQMGIKYRNNGGANANSVAQYAITCMYMLLSNFPLLANLNELPDSPSLGEELGHKTAGIIGMGNVGKSLLDTLNKLGVETTYYNRTEKNVSAKRVDLEKVFDQDIIFITIATNTETEKLLQKLPEYIKERHYLIDVSAHDELYDKKKIISLLEQGKLKGYGLETELKSIQDVNLITTPHMAWCTYDAEKRKVDNYLNRALSTLKNELDGIDFIV